MLLYSTRKQYPVLVLQYIVCFASSVAVTSCLVVATAKAVLLLCVWVLVIALATRDVVQGCVWVVALRSILGGVGLAHSVAITSEPLLFSELSAVTVYDEAAI